MKNVKVDTLLDQAWRIAFDSMTYKVKSIDINEQRFLPEAESKIYGIDKNDWFPIAEKLVKSNPYYTAKNLAEEAATIWINSNMNLKSLKVSFGGDY